MIRNDIKGTLQLKLHRRYRWPRWQMGKNLQSLDLYIDIFFSFKFILRCKQSDIVIIICHKCRCWCHWYRWKFSAGIIDTALVENLPLVSETPAVPVAKFATGGAPWLVNFSTNFRKKFEINPNVIFRGLGEDNSYKQPEAKKLETLSL